jgi:hypothetical protein
MTGSSDKKGITIKVMHGDVECLTVFSNSPIARRMTGYALIQKDLKACLDFLRIHRDLSGADEQGKTLKWATYIALYTTCGKCSVSATGRRIKLETALIPKDYLAAHGKLMTLRHKYTVHAGGYEERGVAPVGLNPDISRKCILEVGPPICLHMNRISERDLNIYENLINKLVAQVSAKVEEARLALRKEVEGMDLDYLYSIATEAS